MKEVIGRNAVVTGAGTGMGRSIALALADAGVNVVVSDIEKDAAALVAEEIRSRADVQAMTVQADVSKLEDVVRLADLAYGTLGSVEILVNNAGVTLRPFRSTWDTSYEDFRWVMEVNFWGVLHGHHVFVPRMLAAGRHEGHIVNTSSIGSLMSVAGHSAYCASKSAVDGFSHSAREELKLFGIGVSLLHPGPVRTRITTSERLRPTKDRSENRPVKPWADYVRDVVNPVVDLPAGTQPVGSDPDFTIDPMVYITPNDVGRMVLDGILENKPHILTHPPLRDRLEARFAAVLAGEPRPPT